MLIFYLRERTAVRSGAVGQDERTAVRSGAVGQDSLIGKSKKPNLRSTDHRFGPHCRCGVFTGIVRSKSLPQNCYRGFGSLR